MSIATTTQRALEDVVAALRAREDEMVEAMLERNAQEVVGFERDTSEPELLTAMRESAHANVRAALSALVRERRPPPEPPSGALEEARAAAQAGMPLAALLHTYRIGHAVVWETIMDATERLAFEPPTRDEVLRVFARYSFAYTDAVIAAVGEEYERERGLRSRRRDERRMQLVRDILGGGTIDALELGYDLSGAHLGAIAWGPAAAGALRRLGDLLERRPLVVSANTETVWGWIPDCPSLDERVSRELTRAFASDGDSLALGEPVEGPEGFRTTHHQARRAQHVAWLMGRPLTRYRDVALEALALKDEAAARELVARELGPLHAHRDGAKLLETLDTYVAAGLNASAAASQLGVHDRTVTYRLRSVERLLAHPLGVRRIELEVALRLRHLLDAADRRAAGSP